MAKKITDRVTWVGKVDWELTHFHGDEYSTHRGSSYNSYLRRGPHAALARHDVHLFQRRRRHPLQLGDGFGQHYATESLFNDTVDQAELNYEAMKYYANILTLYSPMVTRKVNEVLALNLPLKMICPSHGVIWKDNPAQIVEKYLAWAAEYQEDRIAIVYDTMWQSTRLMAEAIADGIRSVAPQTEATLLYTLLKVRYCVTGPHSVMWTVDDEIRDEIGLLVKEHDGMTDEQWLTRATAVIERIEEMIYKESNIPFFHAQRLTVNGDFYFAERFSAMASPSHAAGSAN